jgi:hypothetical protein
MSNNIYDILKKMHDLEAPKQSLTESKKAKPDYIDIDKDGDKTEPMKKAAREKSKGAVAEAVAQVEKQLNEKYMGFKKMNEGNQLPAPPDEVHLPKKGSKHGPVDVYKPKKNEDMLSPGQKKIAKMSPPPDKIDANDLAALRAGKKKKAEGNAFSGAMAKAKASGADEFKVGSKEYKVQEGFPTVADAKKRMDDQDGKTAHGKKTITKTGTKHERDYDAVDKGADVDSTPKGRGRPKKDRFA